MILVCIENLFILLSQIQGMQSEAAILSSPNIWREASRIINEEGFRAFWKGNLVTVAHRLPYGAVNFYSYEEYKTVSCIQVSFRVRSVSSSCLSVARPLPCFFCLQILYSNPVLQRYRGNAGVDMSVHFVSGGLAGLTAASATYPLDLVRTRLSAQVIGLSTLFFYS